MARVYNFSAGPSMLPEAVLKTAQAELLDYHGSGMSVMEMSHRSKWFDEIIQNTEAAMRRVLNIPDNYKIGFFQGGATQQFAMVPLNFMTTGTADYLVTGNFSKKAAEEAAKFGTARIAASSKDKNFTYIPDVKAIDYDPNASYIHICQNNTILRHHVCGTCPRWTACPLVADMSSMHPAPSPWTSASTASSTSACRRTSAPAGHGRGHRAGGPAGPSARPTSDPHHAELHYPAGKATTACTTPRRAGAST